MDQGENQTRTQRKNIFLCRGMTKWHWLVLLGTALGTILEGLVPHSFGTFIANFKSGSNKTADASFNTASQFELNWLPALSSALPCILLPLFSLITRRFSRYYQVVSIGSFLLVAISCLLSSVVIQWQLLFLTYSLIYSVGTSLFLAIVVAIVADYFPPEHELHVLATSLYQIGYPTAALMGNPISANLIVKYGWRNTLKCIALIQGIIGIFLGFFMKPINSGLCFSQPEPEESPVYVEKDEMKEEKRDIPATEPLASRLRKTSQLWPWLVGKYINYLCWYGLRTNIVTYLVSSTSFGLAWSATLMSVYAAAEIVVAILASGVGDRLRGWLVHVHLIAAISMAILTGIYSVALTSYLSAILLMLCIGVAVQFSLSFGYPASVEVLNSDFDMKTGWIITNVAAGFGILTSPIISGLLMDKFRLVALFYAQSVGWTLQAILFLFTILIIRDKKKRLPSDYHELKPSQ